MITWEHLRFLALLIPTWLLLGAFAVTLTIPSKSAAGPSSEASVAQGSLVTCKDSGIVAVQQHKGELIVAAERCGANHMDASEK